MRRARPSGHFLQKKPPPPVAGAKVNSLYHPDLPQSGLINARNAGLRSLFGTGSEVAAGFGHGILHRPIPLCAVLRRLVSSTPINGMIVSQHAQLSRKKRFHARFSHNGKRLGISRKLHPDSHYRARRAFYRVTLVVKHFLRSKCDRKAFFRQQLKLISAAEFVALSQNGVAFFITTLHNGRAPLLSRAPTGGAYSVSDRQYTCRCRSLCVRSDISPLQRRRSYRHDAVNIPQRRSGRFF